MAQKTVTVFGIMNFKTHQPLTEVNEHDETLETPVEFDTRKEAEAAFEELKNKEDYTVTETKHNVA